MHSFVHFDDPSTPFEPVRLTGAVRDPASFQPTDFNGLLRAVVTYILPHSLPDGSPINLSIALGDDVAVDTIVGWPFCHAVHGLIDCLSNTFLARRLDTTFPISLQPPSSSNPPPSLHTTTATTPAPHRPNIDNRPAWIARRNASAPHEPSTPTTTPAAARNLLPTFVADFNRVNLSDNPFWTSVDASKGYYHAPLATPDFR